jgi:hypothetical protein
MDTLLGALVGGGLGVRVRRTYYKSKSSRAEQGRRLRLRCKAHPEGHPDWKLWRGSLVRTSDGALQWRALVRRWRHANLSDVTVLGTHTKQSAADGQRTVATLSSGTAIDQLITTVDASVILERLFRR